MWVQSIMDICEYSYINNGENHCFFYVGILGFRVYPERTMPVSKVNLRDIFHDEYC
mgnify:CR=1 FL=1